MAKILNIDSLAKKVRTLTLGGVNYPIKEMTVADFIDATKQAKELENETDPSIQLEATIDVISRSIPGLEKQKLTDMPIDSLTLIARFIQGELDEGDSEGVTDDEAKK